LSRPARRRDFFLYIKPDAVEDAQAFLASRLAGRAEVRKVSELLQAGYFGPVISPLFRARTGDLVILPYRGESGLVVRAGSFRAKILRAPWRVDTKEMEIPLVTWENVM